MTNIESIQIYLICIVEAAALARGHGGAGARRRGGAGARGTLATTRSAAGRVQREDEYEVDNISQLFTYNNKNYQFNVYRQL